MAAKIASAYATLDRAIHEHVTSQGKELAGTVALFSGGNDSTVLTHLFRDRVTHVGHCNTTIGIEQTREFVRSTAAEWGIPLIEVLPPPGSSYAELVKAHGFPGPGHHFKMYQRLKERGLRTIRRQLVTNGRKQRVVFIAGRRRAESQRRMNIPDMEREGSVVWCSPLFDWTTDDMIAYRAEHPDVPRNEVSYLLHMSGECLCGAFAKPGELNEIAFWFPAVADEIKALEREVEARGIARCKWGAGGQKKSKSGRLCSSCDARAAGDDDE